MSSHTYTLRMHTRIWLSPFIINIDKHKQTVPPPHTCFWAPVGPLKEHWFSEVNGSQVFSYTRGRRFHRSTDLTSLWGLSAGKSGVCCLPGPDSLGGHVWLRLVSHWGPGARSTHRAGAPPPLGASTHNHTVTTHTHWSTRTDCSTGVQLRKTKIFLIRLFFNLWRQGA